MRNKQLFLSVVSNGKYNTMSCPFYVSLCFKSLGEEGLGGGGGGGLG